MVLGEDMLTVERKPEFIVPSHMYGSHTDFSGHEFFEASSIRKRGEKYYFVYSSVVMHELCYAISDDPLGPFCSSIRKRGEKYYFVYSSVVLQAGLCGAGTV